MKRILILALCLSSMVVINFSCSKTSSSPQDNNNNNNDDDGNGIPTNDNTAYVAYYVLEDDFSLSNPHYMLATHNSSLTVVNRDDTTFMNFYFSNKSFPFDGSHTNLWYLCDKQYDTSGNDEFNFYTEFTNSSGKIEAGKTYNLSLYKDGSATPLTLESSVGLASFYHFNSGGSLITTLNTFFGGNGININNSFITIDKIENGTASGTFQFGFKNACARDNGLSYGNNLTGKFNKIPIQQ